MLHWLLLLQVLLKQGSSPAAPLAVAVQEVRPNHHCPRRADVGNEARPAEHEPGRGWLEQAAAAQQAAASGCGAPSRTSQQHNKNKNMKVHAPGAAAHEA